MMGRRIPCGSLSQTLQGQTALRGGAFGPVEDLDGRRKLPDLFLASVRMGHSVDLAGLGSAFLRPH